jgi:3-oxoadipate enol-lactonase
MPQVQIGSGRYFYRREGNPRLPAVVLAHPVGSDHGIWDAVVPGLLRDFHVVRFDFHGHGGSDTVKSEYSVEQFSDDAIALLDTLDIETFSFCGISLGALTGLVLATRHPRRVQRLVVANASAKLPLSREQWNERILKVQSEGMGALVDGMIDRMFSVQFRDRRTASFHTAVGTFLGMSVEGYSAGLAALRDADLRPLLDHISVPTLVIGSALDLAVPKDDIDYLSQAIPGAHSLLLEGGHLSALESSREFADALIAFLTTGQ